MKKSISILVAFISCLLFTNCSSENNSPSIQNQPQTFVKKMIVSEYNDQSEVTFVGTLEFFYNENKQVSYITKTDTSPTGAVLGTSTYSYQYIDDKIVSYNITNGNTNEVLYDVNQLINVGYGSNLVYYSNGDMRKDPYGTELIYQNNNETGTLDNPTIYSYDDKKNPFLNHNSYFKIIFDEQFEAYRSKIIFKSINNIVTQNNIPNNTISNLIIYNTDNFPSEIKAQNVVSSNTLGKFNFEYVSL